VIKRVFALLAALVLVPVVTAAPAMAYEPVNIVHTEHVQAGPYDLTVGFSTWPLRAMQSLDFTFAPDGGLDGKTGTFMRTGPSGSHTRAAPPLALSWAVCALPFVALIGFLVVVWRRGRARLVTTDRPLAAS
jgi:hypothetical protein